MRVKTFAAVTLVALALTGQPSPNAQAARSAFVTGEILVKFRPGIGAGAKADAHRQSGGTLRAEIARTGVQLLGVPAGEEAATVARYQRNPHVLYAEPNFVRRIPLSHSSGSEVVPGDYYFAEQWGLHNAGQEFMCIPWLFGPLCFYVGTPDADIDATEAWAISKGSSGLAVAVIDSGIDYTHPDLAPNFAGGDDFVFDDGDPMDDQGHGTHVAGTIAAAMSNLTGDPAQEEGVVGVAPNARLFAYKVCRADGSCDDFAIQRAIARAMTDGARVINMSLGGPDFSQSLAGAVQDAWNAGLVIVAGAGNDGTTNAFYPAALDNVISVAAFDEDHLRATFSTYGAWVDISAPGNVIISSYPLASCGASTVPGDTGCYTWLSGTSMATPHVSGAAALVWSRPDVTSNSQVVDILLQSADGQGAAAVRLDSWTAHGGLNIHDALSYGVTNLPPVAHAGADQTVIDAGGDGGEHVTLDASASLDQDGSIVSYEWREGSTVLASTVTPVVWFPVGSHSVVLRVTDDHGNSAEDTVVVDVQALESPADTVSILKATYSSRQNELTVEATSSAAPEVTLTVFDGSDPSNLLEVGQLSYNPRKAKYAATFGWPSKPAAIVVSSSGGGASSGAVGGK